MTGSFWRSSQATAPTRPTAEASAPDNEVGTEPIVALAFIEDHLEKAQADAEQARPM